MPLPFFRLLRPHPLHLTTETDFGGLTLGAPQIDARTDATLPLVFPAGRRRVTPLTQRTADILIGQDYKSSSERGLSIS